MELLVAERARHPSSGLPDSLPMSVRGADLPFGNGPAMSPFSWKPDLALNWSECDC